MHGRDDDLVVVMIQAPRQATTVTFLKLWTTLKMNDPTIYS
jgi:hypothetical protein